MTHYLGDAICLIAAETPEILERAKALVKVDYEVLQPVLDPFEALKEDAPRIHPGIQPDGNVLAHEHLVRGNAEEVIANSKYKVTRHYETPWTEHAFLEAGVCSRPCRLMTEYLSILRIREPTIPSMNAV